MPSLTLIRHGQSTYNFANLFTGQLDAPLTSTGAEEAVLAGKKLKAMVFNIAYTSLLIRAQETLRIILQEISQTTITVIKSGALDERMYGDLQGLNKADTAAKYGASQVEIWRRSYDIRPPGGESLEDTFNRVVPYYTSEIAPRLTQGENVMVVAHGNSLRALMMHLENISPIDIAGLNIATCLPRIYNFNAGMELIDVKYI
ncbi:MAG: 2,3-diphosphoglycerate-dependent phosphoglycerate mutase [Rhizobacter sp.]|nr:2,3-diphosphoglycerate-dependent phosphoglycerate mutase [Ferruginibacter sp.]